MLTWKLDHEQFERLQHLLCRLIVDADRRTVLVEDMHRIIAAEGELRHEVKQLIARLKASTDELECAVNQNS